MSISYLLLGGNLGDRFQYFSSAIDLLTKEVGNVIRRSSFYETEPWGFEHEQDFLNQVIIIETILSPEYLLFKINDIEKRLGRVRTFQGYQGRVIDIDILFYDNLILNTPDLVIPHPHIQDRRFTLEPLNELSPEFIHPLLKENITDLLEKCSDTSKVNRID